MKITDWMDDNGYITQHPKYGADCGDTANRHGVYHTFRTDEVYVWGAHNFVIPSGQVVRHPEGEQVWTREEDRSSRDQNIPILCALIKINGVESALPRIASAVMRNFSRFHNYIHNGRYERKPWYTVDVAGPEIWGLFIRGLKLWYLYPLLCIFDFETLVGTVLWNKFKKESNNDIPQHLCVVKTINDVMPTPFGWLALKLLNKESAILKVKQYYDFPGYSTEELKDQVPIGEMIIKWLKGKS